MHMLPAMLVRWTWVETILARRDVAVVVVVGLYIENLSIQLPISSLLCLII